MNRRNVSIVLLAVMLTAALLPTAALANAASMYVVTSNGYGVHMRTSTDTSNRDNILCTVPYNAVVDVLSYAGNGQWAHVAYNGLYGYVMTRYLSVEAGRYTPSGAAKEEEKKADKTSVELPDFSKFQQVTPYDVLIRPSKPNGYVNFRWAPSMQCKVAMRCYANYPLQVIAQDAHWAQVVDAQTGRVGFVYRSFLTTVPQSVGGATIVQ